MTNIFPEHLWYWQKMLRRPFLGRFMAGAGGVLLFSGIPSLARLAGLGLLVAPFQEPRTEYHPSSSGCNGRLPSPGCNAIGRPCSSRSTSEKNPTVQAE